MMITFNHLKTFYNALKEKIKKSRGNWLQNDPTAEDYIKNKPFYTEKKIVTLIEGKDLEIEYDGDYCSFDDVAIIELGKSYTVIINGIEHIVTAEYYASWECIILGNAAILDGMYDGTGLDFAIDNYNDGSTYFNAVTAGTYSVTIKGLAEIVNPIDEKYIPGTIARKDDVSWSSLKNKPFGPITGKMIRTVCDITVAAEDLKEREGIYQTVYQTGYIYAADFYLGDYTYEVIIDGVSYYTQAGDGYSNFDYLGSYDLFQNSNAEYPFLIYKDGNGYISVASYAPGPYTLKIVEYEGGYECKLIAENYIPDTIVSAIKDVSSRFTLTPLQTVTIVDNYDGKGEKPKCTFVEGQLYTVILNGKIYENLVCQVLNGYRTLKVDPGFSINDDGGDGLFYSISPSIFGELETLTITTIERNIVLNEKHIPDTIARTETVQDMIDSAFANLIDTTEVAM